MASAIPYLVILFSIAYVLTEEIDIFRTNNVQKFLRAMTNDTKGADSLNLPANASSIRENITDTFSCENRTYGYYADIDNECQIFHVCLPSQTPSGRNVTYRWSFICPNETIFNQEVLVCTRPRDSIPCEESEMFYYVNMDIGKISDDTKQMENPNKQVETVKEDKVKINKKRPVQRKQNIIVQDLLQNVVDDEMKKIDEFEIVDETIEPMVEEIVPILVDMPRDNDSNVEVIKDNYPNEEIEERFEMNDDERLLEGRSVNYWYGKNLKRGGFRFKADV